MEASELRQRATECRKAAVAFDELADAFAVLQAHEGEAKTKTRRTRRTRKTTRRARKITMVTLDKNYSRKTGAINPGSHQFNIAKILIKPMSYSEVTKALPEIKPGSISATLSKSFTKTRDGKWRLPA